MRLVVLILMVLSTLEVLGQTPEKISYQAIVRNTDNSLVKNSQISLMILVRKDKLSGPTHYIESHRVKTNVNGLVTIEIGTGNALTGNFSELNWASGKFFLETRIDPHGSDNYSIIGVNELLSVPYSLHAKTANTITGKITVDQILDFHQSNFLDGSESAFSNWDKNSEDDFSGEYDDLSNIPRLYTRSQTDSLLTTVFSNIDFQTIHLQDKSLTISKGNKVEFQNWDDNVDDDFSWRYEDLINIPALYTVHQIDSITKSIKEDAVPSQSLTLNENSLSISESNYVTFEGWDTDDTDDFTWEYKDLKNIPALYNVDQIDSITKIIRENSLPAQSLTLKRDSLSLSESNFVIFSGWDTDSTDDFTGDYLDLNNLPELYNKAQVDSIVNTRVDEINRNYIKKPKVISITSSRDVIGSDVGNTLAGISSASLTITKNFQAMDVGETINIEVHGCNIIIRGALGVSINGIDGGVKTFGNDEIYTGGILRKIAADNYIVL
ncbi:MAG: hypothetical protein WBG71_00305 [Leeuwenhoekiella sp.]